MKKRIFALFMISAMTIIQLTACAEREAKQEEGIDISADEVTENTVDTDITTEQASETEIEILTTEQSKDMDIAVDTDGGYELREVDKSEVDPDIVYGDIAWEMIQNQGTFVFNGKGQLVKIIMDKHYEEDDAFLSNEFEYDDAGRLIKQINYDVGGGLDNPRVFTTNVFERDANELLIRVITYDEYGNEL